MKIEQPPCAFCDREPTPIYTGDPALWDDLMALDLEARCEECGDLISPHCGRDVNSRYYVRVPAALQNTPLGRDNAIRRIPMAWRKQVFVWRWIGEQERESGRWWIFEGLK